MTSGATLAPGVYITSNVQLVRPLGAGGMGHVWVARHHGLHSDVVVKFMAAHLAQNADAVSRFTREAAAAALVKSPHVVQTFDHGIALNGLPFIAMELLEGQTLSDRLDAERPMPPQEVATLVQQAARALLRAHERGVVHRDIKPENIFLCEAGGGEGFVKILDFGIAKSVGPENLSMTKTGAVMGTPYYMSPEQVMGRRDVDHRADLWSLGVVAFEALTGQRPFEADVAGALSVMICAMAIPRPTSVAPHLGQAIDAWFERACARAPAERFPDARAMADELARACGGTVPIRLLGQRSVRPPAVETPAPIRTVPMAAPRSVQTTPSPDGPTGTVLATTAGSALSGSRAVAEPPQRRNVVVVVLAVAILGGAVSGAVLATRGAPSNGAAGVEEATPTPQSATKKSIKPMTAFAPDIEPPVAAPSAPPPPPKASVSVAALPPKTPAPITTTPPQQPAVKSAAPPPPVPTYSPPVME